MAAVFKANFSNAEVRGVDVLFVDAGAKCLIQVKRRQFRKAGEGVSTVRNLLGAMLLENALRGIVVSSADHFTYRVYEAAGRARERGLVVELCDQGKLNRMLDRSIPKRPWRAFVASLGPRLRLTSLQA